MTICTCLECGKKWERGEQDDNETICLRCEHLYFLARNGEEAEGLEYE